MFVYAVMEAHFHLSPLIEPIGRKPYLKKWIGHRSAINGAKSKHRQCQFNDIYRYLFQILEKENLELAYKFRYTIEAAGSAPFIERQEQLDKALKRAKNKAFEPLEKFLQQIQMDLGLDYDQQSVALTIKRPIVREAIKPDPEFKDAILPFVPDLTTPDNTDHHIPYGQYNWQQPLEDIPEFEDDQLVASDSKWAPRERFNQDTADNLIDHQPTGNKKGPIIDNLLNQPDEHPDSFSKLSSEDGPIETPAIPEIQPEAKDEATTLQKDSSNVDPGIPTVHTPLSNKGSLKQESLQPNPSLSNFSAAEDVNNQPEDEISTKSGLTENDEETQQESLPTKSIPEMLPDSSDQHQNLGNFDPHFCQSDEEASIGEIGSEFVPAGTALPFSSSTSSKSANSSKPETISSAKERPEHEVPESVKLSENGEQSEETFQQLNEDIPPKSGLTENHIQNHPQSLQSKSPLESDSDSLHSVAKEVGLSFTHLEGNAGFHNQKVENGFEEGAVSKDIEHAKTTERSPLEIKEVSIAADKLLLPAEESSQNLTQSETEKQSTQDSTRHSSQIKSDEPSRSSNNESIKGTGHDTEELYPESINTNEDTKLTVHYLDESNSLKSYHAVNQNEPASAEDKEYENALAEAAAQNSTEKTSKIQAPKSADRSFMKALKSPISHLKAKLSLKGDHLTPSGESIEEKNEHHPNLPKSKRKKLFLPFKIHRSSELSDEEQFIEKFIDNADVTKGLNYKPVGFRSPGDNNKEFESSADAKGKGPSENAQTKSEKPLPEYADPRIGLMQSRKELFLRINKSRENGKNGEGNKPNWSEKSVVANSPPPPLYNFKFTLRKPIIQNTPDSYDHGTALVIFKDCIERRSETAAEKRHFFAGSTTWNCFQRKDFRPFYRDTTSLVIQKDCIKHRIVHNPLPSKHTLAMSSSELETFKAFDSFYSKTNKYDDDLYYSDESDSSFDVADEYSYFDPYEEEIKEQARHEKKRKELYETCLNRINQREGLLFDFKAGKITIDHTDKHEIDRWVRAQQSESIEMYRAYAEAIMHPEIESIKGVQDFVRSKLKKADFPNRRVTDIFDKLKENSYSVELKQHDLVGILKRQDYVSINSDSLSPSLSFSNSYSRYRAWRKTVESPKIEVRPVIAGERRPMIPFESPRKSWSYLDTPKINVRSSSDYQFKRTLPVFDKIYSWKKTHS